MQDRADGDKLRSIKIGGVHIRVARFILKGKGRPYTLSYFVITAVSMRIKELCQYVSLL